MYEDVHDGYDYNKGKHSYKTFSLNGKENELFFSQHKEGSFETNYQTITAQIKGLPFKIKGIEIDHEKIIFDKDSLELENGLVVDKDFTEIHFIGV